MGKRRGRNNNWLADMSLPPGQRRRKKTRKTIGGTPAAQASHASSPKARKKARQGEQKMRGDQQW